MTSPISATGTLLSGFAPRATAVAAERDKNLLYKGLCETNSHEFSLFAVDVFGVMAPQTHSTLRRIIYGLVTTRGFAVYLATQVAYRKILFAIQLGVAQQIVARSEFAFPI